MGKLQQVLSCFAKYESTIFSTAFQVLRSGPIRLNSRLSFLSGFSADSHAASLTVGSITA
jgi:hypothetical protein